MTDDLALKQYYARRAAEYEGIYAKPERQADLRRLEALLPEVLAGRRVLELACGTGYWTQFLARTAQSILALDASPETLELAASKDLPRGRVAFRVADIYELPADIGSFDGAFAGFWWSHVPLTSQARFLEALARALLPGARVVFLDNRYVAGSSTPVSHRDADGNTFQQRRLADGSEHAVLKNFPTEEELRAAVGAHGTGMSFRLLDYYWVFSYEAVTRDAAGR
jgi:demethylmenaquinone methyltransferase/2-methoxy-6-polyprenyl-1,4-benzoquinol methylase